MRVLVTGASGFIGCATVAELMQRGHQVSTLHRGLALPGLESAHSALDIRSPDAREAAGRAEAIVHLAGRGDVEASFRLPLEYNQVNAEGTLNLLEGARHGGALLLLASSQRIYQLSRQPIPEEGPLAPTSPYAYSKIAAETYCRQYATLFGVRALGLRFFSVYGPRQQGRGSSGVVAIFLERALAGLPLVVHDARMRRDFTYVGDVAVGIALALERTWQPGSAYNIATGVGTSLLELATLVKELTGSQSAIEVRSGQESASIVESAPIASTDAVHLIADCSRARQDLGSTACVPLKEGLESCLRWGDERG